MIEKEKSSGLGKGPELFEQTMNSCAEPSREGHIHSLAGLLALPNLDMSSRSYDEQ
jgi:hypothetical protein